MEYKSIKCENCGASLSIKPDENGNVICKYCHSTTYVETDYNKAYDRTKGMLDAQRDHLNEMGFGKSYNNASKVVFVIIGVIAMVMIVGISIAIFSGIKDNGGISNNKYEVSSFNNQFESLAGTNTYGTVYWLIDDAVTNNKTNDRKVEFCLDDDCTKEANDIVLYKDKLDKSIKYEVLFDYDKDGYIYKINVISRKASE